MNLRTRFAAYADRPLLFDRVEAMRHGIAARLIAAGMYGPEAERNVGVTPEAAMAWMRKRYPETAE